MVQEPTNIQLFKVNNQKRFKRNKIFVKVEIFRKQVFDAIKKLWRSNKKADWELYASFRIVFLTVLVFIPETAVGAARSYTRLHVNFTRHYSNNISRGFVDLIKTL